MPPLCCPGESSSSTAKPAIAVPTLPKVTAMLNHDKNVRSLAAMSEEYKEGLLLDKVQGGGELKMFTTYRNMSWARYGVGFYEGFET